LFYETKFVRKKWISTPINGQFFRLSDTLQKIFKCEQLLQKAISYINRPVNRTGYSDINDGAYMSKDGKIPYILYFDEYETGNPLGSHKGKHKIGALYLSLKCFPPVELSALTSIYTVSLFPTLEKNCLQSLFEVMIPEMNNLFNTFSDGQV